MCINSKHIKFLYYIKNDFDHSFSLNNNQMLISDKSIYNLTILIILKAIKSKLIKQ